MASGEFLLGPSSVVYIDGTAQPSGSFDRLSIKTEGLPKGHISASLRRHDLSLKNLNGPYVIEMPLTKVNHPPTKESPVSPNSPIDSWPLANPPLVSPVRRDKRYRDYQNLDEIAQLLKKAAKVNGSDKGYLITTAQEIEEKGIAGFRVYNADRVTIYPTQQLVLFASHQPTHRVTFWWQDNYGLDHFSSYRLKENVTVSQPIYQHSST